MTRVKICGITNVGDALAAIKYGADLLGFIGVRESPRYTSGDTLDDIADACPIFLPTPTVAVVNKLADAEDYPATFVQFYTDSDDDSRCRFHANRRIRSFRMKDASTVDEILSYDGQAAAYHLDAYHKDKLGGSGETFNWDLAAKLRNQIDKPIILAGGLTLDNIADALDAVRPYAVDLSSGVESAPGIKDHAKLHAFIRAVREWDLRQK